MLVPPMMTENSLVLFHTHDLVREAIVILTQSPMLQFVMWRTIAQADRLHGLCSAAPTRSGSTALLLCEATASAITGVDDVPFAIHVNAWQQCCRDVNVHDLAGQTRYAVFLTVTTVTFFCESVLVNSPTRKSGPCG